MVHDTSKIKLVASSVNELKIEIFGTRVKSKKQMKVQGIFINENPGLRSSYFKISTNFSLNTN